MQRDRRPYLALGGAVALLLVLALVPATRAWLAEEVLAPVRAQAEGRGGSYTIASMVFWALAGLALAWPAYDVVFARLGYEPDRRFFLALAPFLLFGPLLHALLVADALPAGPVAWLAAEPPVYLTTAILAVAALMAGRMARQPLAVPLALGGLALLPLLALAAPRVDGDALAHLGAILALALVPAAALAYAYVRLRPQEDAAASLAVISAHALDGATTWMVLRDPFGLGFEGFGEKNPVSLRLVEMSNGWPFFAVKLALPLVLLWLMREDEADPRTRRFLLFAVFVLGYGPGMSNLLQVLLA